MQLYLLSPETYNPIFFILTQTSGTIVLLENDMELVRSNF